MPYKLSESRIAAEHATRYIFLQFLSFCAFFVVFKISQKLLHCRNYTDTDLKHVSYLKRLNCPWFITGVAA